MKTRWGERPLHTQKTLSDMGNLTVEFVQEEMNIHVERTCHQA